jgi:hypothetical protein
MQRAFSRSQRGIIGLIEFVEYLGKHHVTGIAIGALAGSLALAAVLGAIRAATIHLWVRSGPPIGLVREVTRQNQ